MTAGAFAFSQARDFSPTHDQVTWLPDFLSEVEIETAVVPRALDDTTARGVLWQASPGRFLLDVPDVARFLVEAGRTITIDPTLRTGTAEIRRFLRMTPLAALLYQRGILGFHAAAAANSQGAILLAGDSGAGKSTLLAALLDRGWTMLADDLAAVDLNERGELRVWPTFPEIELWQNATEQLGIAAEVAPHRESRCNVLPKTHELVSNPQPLRAIYWLTAHNADKLELTELEGMERFRAR